MTEESFDKKIRTHSCTLSYSNMGVWIHLLNLENFQAPNSYTQGKCFL